MEPTIVDFWAELAWALILLLAQHAVLTWLPRQRYEISYQLEEFKWFVKLGFFLIGVIFLLVSIKFPLGTWPNAMAMSMLVVFNIIAFISMIKAHLLVTNSRHPKKTPRPR
jgi:NADH:ubiquinone oxidoreductase subunit 2 (subunit N)